MFAPHKPNQKYVIGMVHLRPLPGSPQFSGSLDQVLITALTDVETLTQNGVDAIMIENFGDVPFYKADVAPHTIALMTLLAHEIRQQTHKPLGINVLRNDVRAALGIALAVKAAFVRVNVHTGVMITDQGMIEGRAAETLRYRSQLGLKCAILADVAVKHAVPLGDLSLTDAAKDTAYRGLADGLIVSGSGTGQPTSLAVVQQVRQAVPDRPLLIGSGISADNIGEYIDQIDGVIVGSSFKKDNNPNNPVDARRVSHFMETWHSLPGS